MSPENSNTDKSDKPDLPADAGPSIRVGITLAITVCILTIVALGIGAVTWQQWQAAKNNTETLTRQNAHLVISQVDKYLEQYLEPVANYVEHMADHAVLSGWHKAPTSIPEDVLAASIAAAPAIGNAGILFFEGLDVRLEHLGGGTAFRHIDRTEDPRHEDLRPLLATASEARWSRPIFDIMLETPVIKAWRTVRQGDRYFGAWYAGVALSDISQAVTDAGDQFGGTAFVLTDKGQVLAHANLQSLHPEQTEDQAAVPIDRVGDLVLDGLWRNSDEVRDCSCLTSGLVTVSAVVDGKDYTGFFRRIFRYGAEPWIIGVWFVAADIGGYGERLTDSGWAGFGLVVLALVMAAIAGNAIAKPIRRSTAAVASVARMDMGTLERLPPSRISELDDLAHSYNNMRSVLRMFETYVPRTLVRRLIADESRTVDSSERELTVMFTDIVGFTTIAEGHSPAEVAALVNEHFDILGSCVEEQGGTIDKYIGDALMAFWGAPETTEDASVRACYCALAMVDALERDNQRRKGEGLAPIKIRIGIHTGPALVGNIGAKGRVNYTIIGDTVNTCQRIENLGREIETRRAAVILISDSVARDLPASMPYAQVGSFAVKGRDKPVEVYQLMT